MTYKAVVFDMDGTLLDTLDDLADSTNAALVQHGFEAQPTDAYRYYVGSGARKLVERALPSVAAEQAAEVDSVLASYKAHYAGNWNNKTHLYKGLHETLTVLSNSGYALAILTNKPQAFALECVNHYLKDWPWFVVQGQVEGLPLKPSAEISTRVTQALAVHPSEILYVGDSNVDMQTAANAGYTSVGVTWGFRTEKELIEAGARHLIHHPEELLPLLGINPAKRDN